MKAVSADPPEFSARTVTISPARALPVPSVRTPSRGSIRAPPPATEKSRSSPANVPAVPTVQSAPASPMASSRRTPEVRGAARVTRRAGVTADPVPTVTRQHTSLRSSSGRGT